MALAIQDFEEAIYFPFCFSALAIHIMEEKVFELYLHNPVPSALQKRIYRIILNGNFTTLASTCID